MTLAEMQAVLNQAVVTPNPYLQKLLSHALTGGKGLRPTLVLLCARFGIHDTMEVQRVATAIELVHLASLIHDDVLDGAAIRRNQPALHCLFGSVPAVLTGDYLFATAFGLLAKSKKSVLYTVTEAIRSMCSGEIQQLTGSNPDPGAYFAYIGQKTGALISAACRCGGILCGLKRHQQNYLTQYGWHLGLAYQMVDDYLDLFGPAEKMDKPTGQDLAHGILTLPVIRFLELSPDAAYWQEKINRNLTASETATLLAGARHLGCHLYTAEMAQKEINRALEALDKLPVNPVQEELALLAARILNPLGAVV